MTRTNDIDRFAEQVGFPARRAFSDLSDLYPRLERFAALIADAEAKRMHADGMVTIGHMRQQIAAEREACAAVARQWDADHPASNYGGCIANLIEARGQDAA
jgi:hypothetical protein